MNEQEMREEFDVWNESVGFLEYEYIWCAWDVWQAACEIKQKEIDALQYAYQLDEELIGAIQKIITVLNNRPTSDANS